MRTRLTLYVIALVVLPTAVLSMLAAVAVRDREQNIQKRLETAAERTVRSVSQALMTRLSAAHVEVLNAAVDSSRQGSTGSLLAGAGNSRNAFSPVGQVYVIRLPGAFVYPPNASFDLVKDAGSHTTSNAPGMEDAALLAAIHSARREEERPERAVREYEKILAVSGMSFPVRAEATLGAGRCYRKLGEFKLAAGAFRQIAGYADAQGVLPRPADTAQTERDSEGNIYSLTAMKELVGVYRLASELDSPATRGRWHRLAVESEIEFLERVVVLYCNIVPAQRDDLMGLVSEACEHARTSESVPSGLQPPLNSHGGANAPGEQGPSQARESVMPGYERRAAARAKQLLVLLREQQRNLGFISSEGGAVMEAVTREIENNGIPARMTWMVIRGTPFTFGAREGTGNDIVGGFKVDMAGLVEFLREQADQMAAGHGIAVKIERAVPHEAGMEGRVVASPSTPLPPSPRLQRAGRAGPSTPLPPSPRLQRAGRAGPSTPLPPSPRLQRAGRAGQDGFLASGALEWPFDGITLCAYAADPGMLKRNTVLRLILKEWGILMLALGVLAGAWVVFRHAAAETRRLKERGDYVAGISHDLRTPLASMRMLAESLYLGRVEDPERQKQFLETIIGESRRLGHLVERVLFFVRFGENALAYQLRETDIGEVVRQTVDSFSGSLAAQTGRPFNTGSACAKPTADRPAAPASVDGLGAAAGRHGGPIGLFVEPGLPPVMADPVAIGQVVLNLLDNAVKYSKKDGQGAGRDPLSDGGNGMDERPSSSADDSASRPCPMSRTTALLNDYAGRIEVRVVRGNDGAVVMSVKDDGPGMDKRELRKIFRKFYRVRGTARDTVPGIGLGLALCRHIVRGHGGRIEVESEPGKGSTFIVSLPPAGV